MTHYVRAAEIDWIKGAGVCVALHVGGQGMLHRASIGELVERFAPRKIMRIHQSTIVNLDRIGPLEPILLSEFDAVLQNGQRACLNHSHRELIERRLGQLL